MRITQGKEWTIAFYENETSRWKRFVESFRPMVQLEVPYGWWRTEAASNAELWKKFAGEFVVRGGVRIWNGMTDSQRREFFERTSMEALAAGRPRKQLKDAFRHATRFWPQAAESLAKCFESPKVVRGMRFVLLDGLEKMDKECQIRDKVLERCPRLGRKGSTNFLINIGAVKDLAALDSRIVGCLNNHFDFPYKAGRVQGNPRLYLALESALRDVARDCGIELSRLDRAIFQAVGTKVLDKLLGSG